MIRIGRYQLSSAAASIFVALILFSGIAIISAVSQARPEYPLPLSHAIIINEGIALLCTLIYGVVLHVLVSTFRRS